MTTFRWPLLVLTACAALACSPPPMGDAGDAGSDASQNDIATDTAPGDATDAPVDNGPPPMPVEFGPCTTNAECLEGWMCLPNTQGYPGGWCTRMCTTNADCDGVVAGIEGICPAVTSGPRLCQRKCLNGFDCGRNGGYTCAPVTPTSMTNICIPSCDETNCGAGATCNLWTGRCMPSGSPPPTGSDMGGLCTHSGMSSECRSSQCILAQSTTTMAYTGWNGGYCIGNCALPAGWNASTLWPTDDFPRGNCPTGSICFPNGAGLAQYDIGICLRECHSDSDCRAMDGYYCRKTFYRNRTQPHTWNNGYCTPMDCNQAGMTCPTGLTCEVQQRNVGGMVVRVGVCRPPPPPSDGGADASPDATPDVTDDTTSTEAGPADGGLDAATD